MIEIIIIATQSITLAIISALCLNFYFKNVKLTDENLDLKTKVNKTIKDKEEITSIDVADRALIINYGLTYEKEKTDFKVTYEVEILEISLTEVKVKAIDYTSLDSVANDPKNKQGIITFMQNKWISKDRIELVVDDRKRRDVKLKQILDDQI
jgi:hypothetical protein